jgi:hydrogenase expression/formation protein HypD
LTANYLPVNPLDSYINKDVVIHFAGLINDLEMERFTIAVFSKEIIKTIEDMALRSLLPENITFTAAPGIFPGKEEQQMIDKALTLLKDEKSIVVVKQPMLFVPGSQSNLYEAKTQGADVRTADDILGAMVVASKKRRNNVVFITEGYEDEALITAAGLAKAKTVGFRRFFVFQNHYSAPGVTKAMAASGQADGFLLPLKTGLNTGTEMFADIPLLYQKGVVFSGYEAMEIMQSVYMLAEQFAGQQPKVAFQRTKEVSEEVITRSRWMIEEVFENEDVSINGIGKVKNGHLKIKEKYAMFDAVSIM